MAEIPRNVAGRPRPLSPHLTIYRWPITMTSSITHRITGVGNTGGALLLVWWLVAIFLGPAAYDQFMSLAVTPLGQLVLFGFVWSLAYHWVNGVRHLAWDVGYGFAKPVAKRNSFLVFMFSIVIAVAIFCIAYMARGTSL